MSRPVFYMVDGFTLVALILAVLSYTVFHITVPGIIFIVVLAVLIAFIGWIEWKRRQYAFGGGGMMDRGHQTMLSLLDYDGNGTLLEVGCGSGPLSIRAALTWPQTKVVGIDYWGAMGDYSKQLCEKNATSEGAAAQCTFQKGDANKLEIPVCWWEENKQEKDKVLFFTENYVVGRITEPCMNTIRKITLN